MNELEFKIASDICTLNRWDTPARIVATKGSLKREDAQFAMSILEAYVPYEKWIKVWNKEITGPEVSQ